MKFVKMHGLGNDYVFMDAFRQSAPENPAALSVEVSRPHTGVGADGLILILPAQGADARMRIFNADGSEGETCGNGLRCVARYLWEEGICRRQEYAIITGAGLARARLVFDGQAIRAVTVDMGAAELLGEKTVDVLGEPVRFTCVSMGNPHAVCFDRFPEDERTLTAWGSTVETDPRFPGRTNVEFCRLEGDVILTAVWERGSGITQACGSGACACFAAARSLGLAGDTATVRLPGGELNLALGKDGHVLMTGPATRVFRGEL